MCIACNLIQDMKSSIEELSHGRRSSLLVNDCYVLSLSSRGLQPVRVSSVAFLGSAYIRLLRGNLQAYSAERRLVAPIIHYLYSVIGSRHGHQERVLAMLKY